jgi:hypothetical protein
MPANTIFSTLTTPPVRLANGNLDTRYRGGVAPGGGGGGASLIFAPDFNAVPDWRIEFEFEQYISVGYAGGDGSRVPAGFDFFYSGERWHPDGDVNGAGAVVGSQPIGQINNSIDASNKALIIYDESYGAPSEWGSDMILTKEFDTDYQELFAEVKIRFQPNWVWQSVVEGGNNQTMIKVLRIGNFRGADGDNRYTFNTGENVGPLCFFDLTESSFSSVPPRGSIKAMIRHSPYSGNDIVEGYFNESLPSATDYFNDGQWHTLAMHMVMNSAAGVSDGRITTWLDGSLVASSNTIEWNKSAALNGIGLNSVQIGGNANNVPYPEANQHEQWWALKDLKVYTGLPQGYE